MQKIELNDSQMNSYFGSCTNVEVPNRTLIEKVNKHQIESLGDHCKIIEV
jgi:hypothetical protein